MKGLEGRKIAPGDGLCMCKYENDYLAQTLSSCVEMDARNVTSLLLSRKGCTLFHSSNPSPMFPSIPLVFPSILLPLFASTMEN